MSNISHRIVAHPFWPLYQAMRDSIAFAAKRDDLLPHEKAYIEGITTAVEIYDVADSEFKEQWERLNEPA